MSVIQQTVKIWAGRGAGDLTLHNLCSPVERKKPLTWAAQVRKIVNIFGVRIRGSEAAMGGGGAQRPVCLGNELKKTGARTRGQNPLVINNVCSSGRVQLCLIMFVAVRDCNDECFIMFVQVGDCNN
jgi:hypothetical protein